MAAMITHPLQQTAVKSDQWLSTITPGIDSFHLIMLHAHVIAGFANVVLALNRLGLEVARIGDKERGGSTLPLLVLSF